MDVLTYPDLMRASYCGGEMIIAAAVQFSGARLIDNVLLGIKQKEDSAELITFLSDHAWMFDIVCYMMMAEDSFVSL